MCYSRDEMGRMIKYEKEMPSDLEMAEHWRKKYEEARLEQHRLELKIRYELGDAETKVDEISLNAVRNRAIGEFATRLKKLTMITEYDIDMLVEEMRHTVFEIWAEAMLSLMVSVLMG